jgi:hypothetical protein
MKEVRDDFQQQFGEEAPPRQTLPRWEHKLFATGNLKDKQRTGRTPTRGHQCEAIE